MRVVLLALVLLGLTAPAANAERARVGEATTARVGLPRVLPTPAAPVVRAPCPDGGGACFYDGTVFVPYGAGRFAYWHEMGHAFDAETLTPADRAYLQRLMRAPTDWWPHAGEWFADYYAICRLGLHPTHGDWVDSYVLGRPSERRLHDICNTITFLAPSMPQVYATS